MNYSEHIAKAKLQAKGDDLRDSTLFESERGEHIGKVVEVYYNVHRQMLSVRDAKTKKVFAHTILVALEDVTFTVQPAGRDRIRRTNRQNVHAWVRGRVIPVWAAEGYTNGDDWLMSRYNKGGNGISKGPRIRYNPYKNDTFVLADTGKPIGGAFCVIVTSAGVQMMVTDGKPVYTGGE